MNHDINDGKCIECGGHGYFLLEPSYVYGTNRSSCSACKEQVFYRNQLSVVIVGGQATLTDRETSQGDDMMVLKGDLSQPGLIVSDIRIQ